VDSRSDDNEYGPLCDTSEETIKNEDQEIVLADYCAVLGEANINSFADEVPVCCQYGTVVRENQGSLTAKLPTLRQCM
jgi:hypothetical protein